MMKSTPRVKFNKGLHKHVIRVIKATYTRYPDMFEQKNIYKHLNYIVKYEISSEVSYATLQSKEENIDHKSRTTLKLQQQHQETFQYSAQHFDYISQLNHSRGNVSVLN